MPGQHRFSFSLVIEGSDSAYGRGIPDILQVAEKASKTFPQALKRSDTTGFMSELKLRPPCYSAFSAS